jgi:hypothetical protein
MQERHECRAGASETQASQASVVPVPSHLATHFTWELNARYGRAACPRPRHVAAALLLRRRRRLLLLLLLRANHAPATMMLLIGMKISFTKKPMKPMMAKPMEVA